MSIIIGRAYSLTITSSTIELTGDAVTATWDHPGIGILLSVLNDGSPHFLVADLENEGGGTWRLLTSVDGAAFEDQNTETGPVPASVGDTDPSVALADVANDAYLDEAAMWVGHTTFTSGELSGLYDLAEAQGVGLDQWTLFTTTLPPTTTPTPTTPPPTTTPTPTTPPPTTTVPSSTTTAPAMVPHPADTAIGNAIGNEDFAISSSEVLAYANAFLSDDAPTFPGISAARTSYVLRAAAIFLANFQARYEDVGTLEPVDNPLHPARWQELPDL